MSAEIRNLLPKPVWNQLPEKELKLVTERLIVLGNKYQPAFYGAIFNGRKLNADDVAEIGTILGDVSERLGFTSRIAFFRFGDNNRQVILPLRPINLDVDLAFGNLDAILRYATDDLIKRGLPVVESPVGSGNIFKK